MEFAKEYDIYLLRKDALWRYVCLEQFSDTGNPWPSEKLTVDSSSCSWVFQTGNIVDNFLRLHMYLIFLHPYVSHFCVMIMIYDTTSYQRMLMIFIGQVKLNFKTANFALTIIARRSRNFAGTRCEMTVPENFLFFLIERKESIYGALWNISVLFPKLTYWFKSDG